MISRGSGSIADPALVAVEADEIAAHACRPGDALAVQVHPANAEFGWRKLVGLGQSGYRRIRTQPIRSCWAPTSLGHAAKNVATLSANTLA